MKEPKLPIVKNPCSWFHVAGCWFPMEVQSIELSFRKRLLWSVPLAQVLPCPQLIFPSKT